MTLFHDPIRLPMPGADVVYHENPDLGIDADALMRILRDETPWQQNHLRFGERMVPEPRLVSWHGDGAYSYSGLTLAPNPWTPTLAALRDRLQEIVGARFNSVLLNLYRSGRDSIGMHADDEPELGREPVIASVSLGDERRFRFERKDRTHKGVGIDLAHGSLVVMRGQTQRNWKHGIDKIRSDRERINLTFRMLQAN